MACIYCILDLKNHKKYIGSANDFKGRKRVHLFRLRHNKHHSIYLQRSWNIHGPDNFSFFIVEDDIPKDKLYEREQWWIDNHICEYNMSPKARGSLGIKRRPETIEKIRNNNLGLKHPEWRNELKSKAQGGENHWAYGKPMRESTRLLKSKTMTEKYKNGFIHPSSKKVDKFDLEGNFIRTFNNSVECVNGDKKKAKNIQRALKSKSNIAYGYIWKYHKDN